jgi:hypothetical protein
MNVSANRAEGRNELFTIEHWGDLSIALRDALIGSREFESVNWSTEVDQSRTVADRARRIGYFGVFLPANLMRSGTPTERHNLESLWRDLNRQSWTGFDIIVPSERSIVREYRVQEDQEAAFKAERTRFTEQLSIPAPASDSVVLIDNRGHVGVVGLPGVNSGIDNGLLTVARSMSVRATAAQAAVAATGCQGRRRKWGRFQWLGILNAWEERLTEAEEWHRSIEAGADNQDRELIAERRAEEAAALRKARNQARAVASIETIAFLTSIIKVRQHDRSPRESGVRLEVAKSHDVDDVGLEIEMPEWYSSTASGLVWPPGDGAYRELCRVLETKGQPT